MSASSFPKRLKPIMYELIYWQGMFWEPTRDFAQEQFDTRQALIARMVELAGDKGNIAIAGLHGVGAVGSLHAGVVVINAEQMPMHMVRETTLQLPWNLEEQQTYDQMRIEIDGLRQKLSQSLKWLKALAGVATPVACVAKGGYNPADQLEKPVRVNMWLELDDVNTALAAFDEMRREVTEVFSD